MRLADLVVLTTLAAVWGASFLFIRVAVNELEPLPLMCLRFLVAALLLTLLARWRGQSLRPIAARWRDFLLIGAINSALPGAFVAIATLHLNASLASILNATTPLFAVLAATLWLGDRFTMRRGVGLAIGMIGIVVLAGWSPLPVTSWVILGIVLSVLATVGYAISGIFIRRRFAGLDPITLSVGQLTVAGMMLLPPSLITLPEDMPGGKAWLALLGLATLSTAFGYLLYFHLMQTVGPTKTSSVTYLIPVFGIFWGVLLLDEPIGIGTMIGFGLVLISVLLVTDTSWRARPLEEGTA